MSTSSNPQEVEVPTPTPALTPEQVVAHLRALQAQLGDVTPLTAEQRKTLRQQSRMSEAVVQASLNVLGAADIITQAVGLPADEVQSMIDEANRWNKVCATFGPARLHSLASAEGQCGTDTLVCAQRRSRA